MLINGSTKLYKEEFIMSGPINIGVSIPRKESLDKVTGAAKYTDDLTTPGMLYAKLLTSPHAHANIKSINIEAALKSKGVKSIITGDYFPTQCGANIEDRPPLAKEKVRYFGEPIAIAVASSEEEAARALKLIKVEYEQLPVVNSVNQAVKPDAPLIHPNLSKYTCIVNFANPKENSNIATQVKIRKGNMAKGWADSDVVVESSFTMPKSDHLAMETRNAKAQILPDGRVIIYTSSQAPFHVKQVISKHYNISEGNIIVRVPLVGGAFGGKACVQLELLAYLASKSVGGKMVKIANTREEDMVTSPSKIGLEANLKIGASKDGMIKALECTYLVDCGAYTDTSPTMTKAIAVDCTGPYNIENVSCDSLCVYTNHTYATSYRSFGHVSFTFCIERLLDKLAAALKIDMFDLRRKNAISPGNFSPTQVKITESNTGSLQKCLDKLRQIINWNPANIIEINGDIIHTKAISCFWKTSDSPSNAVSGVILTFNKDGSINLNCGAVEIGPGMKTAAAQILAKRMNMDVSRIHVFMGVDTQISPEHWKTVASVTTFMVGKSVLKAAEDLIKQLISIASIAMKCPVEDLEVANEKVFLKDDPDVYISFKDLVHGFSYTNGISIGGQIIGKGSYMVRHITELNKENGKGKAGPFWTVGAQAVEIEYNPKNYTYRILKAATVIDAGKVINPKIVRGLIMGGMNMGLGIASREEFLYNDEGIVQNTSLRTYKLIRFGETPEYIVDFIETPQIDAPYGARGLAEHGIIGIPAAFATALSLAAESEFLKIPITPEVIWQAKTGGKYDTL